MTIGIIGIDCATQPRKTGLALGFFEAGNATLAEVSLGTDASELINMVLEWIDRSELNLITLDAPLGWPAKLGKVLHLHKAGQPIDVEPNLLFRRETDRFIKSKIGKQPLDVGADRIARTARAALFLLDEVRQNTGKAIPLAWAPGRIDETSAIEVYPAATLLAYRIHVPGYKQKDNVPARKNLIIRLKNLITFEVNSMLIEQNDDALDAVLCILAGADFLRGDVYEPRNLELAKKEGWIWVQKT